MINQREINILIKLFFLLNASRNICLFFSLNTIATGIFFSSYIVYALLIVVILLIKAQKPIELNQYFLVSYFLLFALVIVHCFYSVSIWTVNGYTPLSFFMTILFIAISRNVIITSSTIEFCCVTYIFQGIIAMFCVFIPGSFEYGSLVLHIGNPNQTAILLWEIFAFSFLYWHKNRIKGKHAIGLWIIMIGVMIMIYLTNSRSVILSCVICVLGYFWLTISTYGNKLPLVGQRILLATPLLFPVAIVTMVNLLPNEVMVFGKRLFSGREQIWKNIIDSLLENPFSHHMLEAPYYSRIMQDNVVVSKAWGSHNGILAVQWNYGCVVAILVIILFMINVSDLKKYAEKNINSCMIYLVVLASIVSTSFEEGLLMGNICTTSIFGLLFMMGRSEVELSKKEGNS